MFKITTDCVNLDDLTEFQLHPRCAYECPSRYQMVIGKGLGPKFEDKPRTIIGIFGDTHDNDLAQATEPTMVIPDAQEPEGIIELTSKFGPIWWMVRTHIEPHQLIPQCLSSYVR